MGRRWRMCAGRRGSQRRLYFKWKSKFGGMEASDMRILELLKQQRQLLAFITRSAAAS